MEITLSENHQVLSRGIILAGNEIAFQQSLESRELDPVVLELLFRLLDGHLGLRPLVRKDLCRLFVFLPRRVDCRLRRLHFPPRDLDLLRPGASLEHAKSRGLFGDLPFRLSQIGAVVPVDEAGDQVAHAHYIPLIHGDLFDDPGHLGSHVRVAAGEDLELPGGLQLHGDEEEDSQEACEEGHHRRGALDRRPAALLSPERDRWLKPQSAEPASKARDEEEGEQEESRRLIGEQEVAQLDDHEAQKHEGKDGGHQPIHEEESPFTRGRFR